MGCHYTTRTFIYQVKGRFQANPEGVHFVPDFGSLGQAPLGILPLANDWLFSYVGKQYQQAEDISWLGDAFVDLESVEISEGQLILRRKTEG